jgi:hypothetical protein
LAGVALALALVGCSPVESYRSLVGVDRNDPNPESAPFTQNLAAGEVMAYPNLATVPPPPTRATTTAERQKLTETLVAHRTETQASATGPAPSSGATASSNPPDLVPCKSPMTASANPTAVVTPGGPGFHQRKRGEPPEPQPRESTLQVPEVRAVPEPEVPCASLPPPNLAAAPPLTPTAPARSRETVEAGMPVPPPPVPVIAEVPPPNPGKPIARQPAAPTLVAALELPGTPPRIDDDSRAQIERIAALYNEQRRRVRVVAYVAAGAPGAPGGEPLAGYHAALERAQTVAAALRAAGIPADKIQAEAAPAGDAGPIDRIEIQLMP